MTLDEPISEDLILDVISTIFQGLKEKPKVKIEKGSKIGEGFLGITSSVQVKIGEETKHLFVKTMPQNKKLRKALLLDLVFEREASFYLELHPILNQIYRKHLRRDFDITPTCLLVKKDSFKEAIVFDNVSVCGYSTRGGKEPLNKNHLLLSLKTYSKLHACGFLLKNDYPDEFEKIVKSKPGLFFKIISVFDDKKLALFGIDILKKHCSYIDDKPIINNFDEIKTKIMEVDDCANEIEEYSTVTHMDCWKNNLMFKCKQDSNDLEDMKLVDMQMWTINSPVFDILHVIYSNIPDDENLDDIDYYFDYYYESLYSAILEMSGNPEVLYPRNVYLSHLKKYRYYGLLMACLVWRTVLADSKDVPNMAEMVLHDKPLTEAFIYTLPDEELYCKKLKVILRHFIKNKVF